MNLSPTFSLKDIYGPDVVFNPRISYSALGWIPTDPDFDEFRTGALLSIAGDMPFVCHSGVKTEEALNLIKEAGIAPAENLYTYDCRKSFGRLMDSFISKGETLVVNQIYPENELPSERYWVEPDLHAFINNKANLEKLVPKNNLPSRMTISPEKIDEIQSEWGLPFVLKAATDLPTGGGVDVVLCHTQEDINEAKNLFKDCTEIVVEELVEVEENYCVQFCKTHDGKIHYLGATEQIISSEGNYLGNWISDGAGPPANVIALGQKIMEKACSLGYWGVAGFDILVTKDDRIVCIDLNFRLNGSTPALLLKESILANTNKNHIKFSSLTTMAQWEEFDSICKKLIEDGRLVPLSIYRPQDNSASSPVRISALLVGDSRENINETEQYLQRQGWI